MEKRAKIRDDILFRTRMRTACIVSLKQNQSPYTLHKPEAGKSTPKSSPTQRVKSTVQPKKKGNDMIIDLQSESDSEDTMDYEEHNKADLPALETHATPIPIAVDADSKIPTLTQLWKQIHHAEKFFTLNPGACEHVRCKYCTGGLIAQRYHLVSRLIRLERVLFQDGTS